MQADDSSEKSLMLGKIEGRRKKGHRRMRWLDSITDAMDMNLGKLPEMVRDGETWHAVADGVTELDITEQLNNTSKANDYELSLPDHTHSPNSKA